MKDSPFYLLQFYFGLQFFHTTIASQIPHVQAWEGEVAKTVPLWSGVVKELGMAECTEWRQ